MSFLLLKENSELKPIFIYIIFAVFSFILLGVSVLFAVIKIHDLIHEREATQLVYSTYHYEPTSEDYYPPGI